MERVLVIAGFDPSGGAGVLMDVKMFALLGIKAASVPTALTVQSSKIFHSWVSLEKALFEKMLKCTLEDLPISGVKIGMLGVSELVNVIAFYLKKYRGQLKWVVYDPVLRATLKKDLFEGSSFLENVKRELLPVVDYITPNCREAEVFAERAIEKAEDWEEVAKSFYSFGVKRVIIKGVREKGRVYTYYFEEGRKKIIYSVPEIPLEFHGTGCAFSSLFLGYLIKGWEAKVALKKAINRLYPLLKRASLEANKEGLTLIF